MNFFPRPRQTLLAALVAVAVAPLTASAQIFQPARVIQGNPPVQVQTVAPITTTTTTAIAPTIGSHQIDRFEAIRQLQADLGSDANNVANWTILGELAHEVALDVPQGQDDTYYKLSREAYERASQLDPSNPGLKSALQFARDQEANSASFDTRRRQGVMTYLEARRREMAANGVNPTVMVYESPATSLVTTTPGQVVSTQPTSNVYPTPSYRPYYNQQAQQPYGYNQYSSGFTPTANSGSVNGLGTQVAQPTTLRQYGQQLPGVLMNQGATIIRGR